MADNQKYGLDDFELYKLAREFRKNDNYGNVEENQTLKKEAYTLIRRINGYIAYLRKCKQED